MTGLGRRFAFARCALFLIIILATGCSHVVRKINEQWPPKTSCDAQLSSVNAATADLSSFTAPAAAYVGVAGEDISGPLVNVIEPLVPGVHDLKILTGQQEIVASFGFSGQFVEEKVFAAGDAILHASMRVEGTHLVIEPTFEQIKLSRVRYRKSDFPDEDLLIPLLNAALKAFIANINSAIPLQKIQLSTRFVHDFDPNVLLRGQQNVESVYGKPVRIDIAIGRSSILIDPDGIHVLAELVNRPPDSTFMTPTASVATSATCDLPTFPQKFDAFKSAFVAKAGADLGSAEDLAWTKTAAAVRKSFIAESLNFYGQSTCVDGVGNCTEFGLTYAVPRTDVDFKETLKTDPEPDLKCGQNYPPFQPDACNAGPCDATRGCPGSCEWWDGGCHAWKPVCEALKASEKLACETAEAGKKAACEANNQLRRVTYEAEKSARIAGCQLNQKWLHEWAETDVGDVAGRLTLDGTKARLGLHGFSVANDLSSIRISSTAEARSDVTANIEFLPKNIGHVLCQARWNARVNAVATGSKLTRDLDASLTPVSGQDGALVLEARPNAQEFQLKLTPPPVVALLTQNPHVVVACAPAVFLGLAGELIGSVQRALKIGNPTSILTEPLTTKSRI